MEFTTKEVGDTTYVMKMFPAMFGLSIVNRMEKEGGSPEIIKDVITKGATIGSVAITDAKFNTHFAGKYEDIMTLFYEILKYNKLMPDEQGNGEGSEEQ